MNNVTDDLNTIVRVESAWASKINWTQAIGLIAQLLMVLSGDHYHINSQMQANIVMLIGMIQSVLTVVLRTSYTTTITPSSANKVKGSASMKVLGYLIIAPLLALFLMTHAQAADIGAAANAQASVANIPLKAPTLQAAECDVTSCSGPYVGADLIGNGTNADIVGNGINQSVFAAGGIVGLHAGWQFWNGNYFAAIEGGLGYNFPPAVSGVTVSNNFANSIYGEELIKLGAGLNVFNQTATTASGQTAGPINVPASLSSKLISPYIVFGGIQDNGVTRWVNGAGAEFALASGYSMDISYMYAPSTGNQPAANLVKLGLHYFFKP